METIGISTGAVAGWLSRRFTIRCYGIGAIDAWERRVYAADAWLARKGAKARGIDFPKLCALARRYGIKGRNI